MSLDAESIIGFLLATLSTVFWYMLKARDKRLDKHEDELDRVKENYQKRDDAIRDFDLIIASLNEIKSTTQRISDKIDQKADK